MSSKPMSNITTISIDVTTKERLDKHFQPKETWDGLINRLLDNYEKENG